MIIVTRGWPGTFYAGVIGALALGNRNYIYDVEDWYGHCNFFNKKKSDNILFDKNKRIASIYNICKSKEDACVVVCGMNILHSHLSPFIQIGYDTGHDVYQALPYDVSTVLGLRRFVKDKAAKRLVKSILNFNASQSFGYSMKEVEMFCELFYESDLPMVPKDLLIYGQIW